MKIAITGATGQIGVCLTKELLRQGHSVKALIYDSKKGLENHAVDFLQGDVLHEEDCSKLCQDADALFHLAANISISGDRYGKVWNTNVNGTRNVLNACVKHRVKKVVHFSSVHAYDMNATGNLTNEYYPLAINGMSPYAQSKAIAQKMVLEYTAKHKLNASILNPTAVLGLYDYQPSVKGRMLIDFYNGKIPMLMPGGFDWLDTRDLVKTAIAAMTHGAAGECYLVSGKYYTLVELAAVIGKVTNKKMPGVMAPAWLMKTFLPAITLYGRIKRTEPLYTNESLAALLEGCDNITCKKAKEQLGHSSRPIEETITDTYEWFKQEGFIS
jgi:dihydroflavonol-4-reductase